MPQLKSNLGKDNVTTPPCQEKWNWSPSAGKSEMKSDPVPVWELNDGGQFVTIRLMNRARVLYENDKRYERPGIDRPNTYSYYVGFDSWEMRPAFFDATRTTYNSNIADQNDSYENRGFKQASSERRARCIVPPCDILRTGALSHIKARRHVGRESGGTEATACEKFLERQNQALKAGLPCPVLVERPDLPTDYAVLEKMKPDNWMYFRMMMPKIGRLNVPKELGEAVFQFQSKKKYCLDLLSLNLAISMCIVWHRYTTDPHHGAELEAFNNPNPKAGLEKKVTVPPLASFLLYAPHFFRFHEYYGLSAYMHIFRYVQHMHSRDVKLSAQFRINRKGIDESLVKRVVSQMNLQHDDWIEIVPPSWHGSRLTMPANHGPRALQSDETTAALLLDDINTLGFYNYTNADSYSFPRGHESHGKVWTTRDLQIHVDWVPQHVCSVAAWRYLDETPTSPSKNFGSLVYVNGTSYLPHGALDAWNENFKITHLWTAPKTAVRRPWKDCVKIASWEGQPSDLSSDGESFDELAEEEHRSDGAEDTDMIPVGPQDFRADEPARELLGDEEPGMDEHEHEQLGGEETESGHSDGQQNAVSSAVRNIEDVDEIGDIVLEGDENPRRRRSDRTIQPAAVRDATAQTDLISDKDRRILRRLLMEDLADDKHFRQISLNDFMAYRTESTEDFQNGRICSVLVNNASAQTDYAMLPSTAPESWTGFRMLMPKLANIVIPQDFTNEVAGFLEKYNKDLVELTFAVSMALVWARLSLAPGHQPELCTIKPGTDPSDGQAKKTVPPPSLAVFILYSPHFFRLHEDNSLAVYGHIFRFASSTYARDSAYNEAFRITASDIDEKKILELFSTLNLEDVDWMEIVPPSFEGSTLPMPTNRGCRAPRGESTTASLMLPDIHSIGLPDYRNEMKKNCGLVIRDVVVHKTWATPSVVNERSWAQNYSGPAYFTNNALKRYLADGGPQLWSAPRTAVRAPWRDAIRSTYNSSTGQLRTPSTTPTPNHGHEQRLKQESTQPEQPLSPEVPEQPAVEFSKQLVIQFRIAQEKGFITPNVRLEDTGLVWEGIENEIESTKTLLPAISLSQLVAADAAAQADLLLQRDKAILQRLVVDLENSNNVPRCMMSFKLAIYPLHEHTTRSRIVELIQDTGQPLEAAMNRLAQYCQGDQQGEAAFIRHIIKPCCVLLDIDYPGTLGEGHRAIIQNDLDVGMAISNITYLGMLPNTGSLHDAVRKLQHANKFASIWRFLFKDRLMGIDFDDRRKALWAKAFGEPYDDGEERAHG
ncbi:hypothetical protein GCG54_00006801 [Colletotrichum gloeosporioides]|uniref:Uncharacterized protein n=1 Tax=Colletotrichum gloeosporioides TaxID=474922 RepID=A0A8H4CQG9_COLGL|nr:uncharacterized protein GCG54_00006801 [Colletotrichum gloeosporioides]KAF3808185.1 hypothetical protein GCG54_00006801 [Colletotrichum gloeosporioides]